MAESSTAADISLLTQHMPFLEAHENPAGKCDDWNSQFTQKAIEKGFAAATVGESNLGRRDKTGKTITHHAIAVGFSHAENSWFGADLSAGQIEGHEGTLTWEAASLSELAQTVRQELGGNWDVLNNEQTLRAEMDRQKAVYQKRPPPINKGQNP